MELCDTSLAEVQLKPNEALWMSFLASMGLKYAHDRGIYHGDLKPSNILLKLPKSNSQLSSEDIFFSTPKIGDWCGGFTEEYKPPEVKQGKKPDARSDIYQLGLILYELITGKLPNKPEDLNEIPDIRIRKIVEKCLKENPDERYQSISEFQKAVLKVLSVSLSKPSLQYTEEELTLKLKQALVAYYSGEDVGGNIEHIIEEIEKKQVSEIEKDKKKRATDILERIWSFRTKLIEDHERKIRKLTVRDVNLLWKTILDYSPKDLKEKIENDEYIGKFIEILNAHLKRDQSLSLDDTVIDKEHIEGLKLFCDRLVEMVSYYIKYD